MATLAEFNAARKILMRQLEAAAIDLNKTYDLAGTASELQATAILLHAIPAIPDPVAAAEFRDAVAAFGNAITDILRSMHTEPATESAAQLVANAAVSLLQANAHYRAATEAMNGALSTRAGSSAT